MDLERPALGQSPNSPLPAKRFASLILAAMMACGGAGGESIGGPGSPNQPPQPVVASVTVTPPAAALVVGDTIAMSASARDASGNPMTGRAVAWSASPVSVATISSSGLVTAIGAGTVTVTA